MIQQSRVNNFMYNFLKNENIKNPNVRHNLLNMDNELKSFNDGHEHSGGFLFIIEPKNRRVLLGKRGADAEFEPNAWNPFGGTMEKNECPLLTAIREVYEESEILPSQYKINPNKMFLDLNTDNEGNTHRVHIYITTVDDEIEPKIDEEHSDARWFDLDEITSISLFSPLKRALQDDSALKLLKQALIQQD